MIIGFSTGSFWKFIEPISKEAIKLNEKLGANAIELHAGSLERIEKLQTIEKTDLSRYKYVSIHAPADMDYINSDKTKQILKKIESACQKLPIDAVTFHPDTIKDRDVLLQYTIPYAFENMDEQKEFGQTADDIEIILNKGYKFVFDVNHIMTIDLTLKKANSFIPKFNSQLTHVHFSGMLEKEGMKNHHAIFETKQNELFKITPNAPIIIESQLEPEQGELIDIAEKELNYIKTHL